MDPSPDSTDVIFGLDDRPTQWTTLLVALQHVSAIVVAIITPPLLIASALGLTPSDSVDLIGMSLAVSGLATFIQCRTIGPVGSGLLSIQGTSFTFMAPLIAAGTALIDGGMPATGALGVLFGVCLLGSTIEMVLSRFLRVARAIITPTVTGIVVTLIGLTLIKVGMITMAGGPAARADGTFGSPQNLALAALVLGVIVALNRSRSRTLRMSSIVIGLAVGYAASVALGRIDFTPLRELSLLQLPVPFRHGLGFRWSAFVPIALIYLITAVETIGDLTATSLVSGEPVHGELYMRRLRGGVLGDGVNSALAAIFNTFPNTTFSQNNGVIQLTGVASRAVGYAIAGILVVLGVCPLVAGLFQIIPPPVLGGATLIMFGTVAAAGIRIIASEAIDRRAMLIIAVSLSLGLGVTFVPEVLAQLPPVLADLLQSGITTGGLAAIVMSVVLGPRR